MRITQDLLNRWIFPNPRLRFGKGPGDLRQFGAPKGAKAEAVRGTLQLSKQWALKHGRRFGYRSSSWISLKLEGSN